MRGGVNLFFEKNNAGKERGHSRQSFQWAVFSGAAARERVGQNTKLVMSCKCMTAGGGAAESGGRGTPNCAVFTRLS